MIILFPIANIYILKYEAVVENKKKILTEAKQFCTLCKMSITYDNNEKVRK